MNKIIFYKLYHVLQIFIFHTYLTELIYLIIMKLHKTLVFPELKIFSSEKYTKRKTKADKAFTSYNTLNSISVLIS